MNLSFTDILRGTEGLAGLPAQDLVYSVGLLDYLTDHRAKALVKRLYDLLMPGGLLIIGADGVAHPLANQQLSAQ